ncbi:prepilin-type N-terminal cleavage/methylation domain-containing protein [Pannus brasiliensis CCIBt3594]|uniref:Prepilin-type N-terminal cleavage/methylation domain-containing protein n=1 Tax=Pannus brasiliensis CCIBt3594 TaxID=1427578 RepID=A0AAW9QTB5_9CHRO
MNSPKLGTVDGQSGYTLAELLITIILLTILLMIGLSFLSRFIAELRLRIAMFELSQQWKFTRFDATGSGATPAALCMRETAERRIEVAKIQGDRCESAGSEALAEPVRWQSLTAGVEIDEENSTLRRVSGVAGNSGDIYRVSWADTRAGLGGAWGQLGRLTLIAPGTPAKKCLFLFNTDGSWNIREDSNCNR